jgi:hypothetical protein
MVVNMILGITFKTSSEVGTINCEHGHVMYLLIFSYKILFRLTSILCGKKKLKIQYFSSYDWKIISNINFNVIEDIMLFPSIYGAQKECVTINQVNCEKGLPLVGFLVNL